MTLPTEITLNLQNPAVQQLIEAICNTKAAIDLVSRGSAAHQSLVDAKDILQMRLGSILWGKIQSAIDEKEGPLDVVSPVN